MSDQAHEVADPAIAAMERAVRAALSTQDPDPQVIVTHGFGEALRVIGVSSAFDGLPAKARNKMVGPNLRELDPEILLRLSVVMLMTPEEYADLQERRELAIA